VINVSLNKMSSIDQENKVIFGVTLIDAHHIIIINLTINKKFVAHRSRERLIKY